MVSRTFIAENDDIATAVCAPIYGEILGIRSEIVVGTEDGLPRESSIRCDFLMLMFKRKLTRFVAALPAVRMKKLDTALRYALELAG